MAPAELPKGSAQTCLRSTEIVWASDHGGCATAVALLLLLVSYLLRLCRSHRRRPVARAEHSVATSFATSTAAASSATYTIAAATSSPGVRIENLVTDADLRQLIPFLDRSFKEGDGWEHVISRQNDNVSYRAWCEKTKDGPPRYFSVTTFERCSMELLRDFYMDNEYRTKWDDTVVKHEHLQFDGYRGIGRTVKKFPLLTPREYVLAWRAWEASNRSFYCISKDSEHPLAPRQRNYVRIHFLRSGWCIRKVPGRDACEIKVLHHEDNGMNVGLAKMAFSKGIWSYVCKTQHALCQYSKLRNPSRSILAIQGLVMNVPVADMDSSQHHPASGGDSATTRQSVRNSVTGKMIANGLLLLGSVVCLSRGRSNLGAQLAMAFFVNTGFKQGKGSGLEKATREANIRPVSGHSR